MKEIEYDIGRNRFICERSMAADAEEIRIVGFRGTDAAVEVPDKIDGAFVTAVGKKAFLSKKTLKRIALPETVREIGDWAFAYCDGLESVRLPAGKVVFGKAVFLECGKLKKLQIADKNETTAALLAAAVKNGAYYLLDTVEAGNEEWLAKWDSKMMMVLNAGDRDGYSRQVLCGEEDYGSTNLDEYMKESRRKKIRLILIRLLHPESLKEEYREIMTDYCLMHTKGCGTEEMWEVIRKEYGEDREFYELFAEMGCLTAENIAAVLGDLGEEYPEMKAFFIDFHERKNAEKDFFDGLFLD